MKLIKNDFFIYVGICVLCVLLCILLSIVYPFTFLNADAPHWLWHFNNFSFFNHTTTEVTRRLPFGFLIHIAFASNHPTLILRIVHSGLFASSMMIFYWFSQFFFSRSVHRIITTSLLILMEITTMNLFFTIIGIESEPLYSYLLFNSIVLILGGVFIEKKYIITTGAFLLGIASFVRPIGIIVIPIWVLFFIILGIWQRKIYPKKLIIICILLICIWNGLWQIRQFVLGYSNDFVQTGMFLFARNMPLLTKDTVLLKNTTDNQILLNDLFTFNANKGTEFHDYLYHFQKYSAPNETILLSDKMEIMLAKEITLPVNEASRKDILFATIGKRIALHNPYAYIDMVLPTYINLYKTTRWCRYNISPNDRYAANATLPEGMKDWFPEQVDISKMQSISTISVAMLLGTPCYLINRHFYNQSNFIVPFLSHIIPLISSVYFIYAIMKKRYISKKMLNSLVTCSMFFVTTFAQFTATSILHITWYQYTAPGELFIYCICILGIFVQLPFVCTTIYEKILNYLNSSTSH